MDPSYRCRPCFLSHPTHHPHPHHPLFFCPHHHHHHHHHFLSHPHICPRIACSPQNPEAVGPVPLPNMEVSAYKQTHDSGAQMLLEQEHEDKEEEEEEDEEPVFVLTDEWMEFFAKSEAKRKLARKQAKKKGKN